MKILKDDNGIELSAKVQKRVNKFIDKIKTTQYFRPKKNISKEKVDAQINFTLKCFGVEATIEYKKLSTEEERDTTRSTERDTTRDIARATVKDAVKDTERDTERSTERDTVKDAVKDAVRSTTRDTVKDTVKAAKRAAKRAATRDTVRAMTEILLKKDKKFKEKYQNGAFRQLYKIWEFGLYPAGVVNGKFICYVPEVDGKLPHEFRYLLNK